MIEHLKFWLAKEAAEFLVGIGWLLVLFLGFGVWFAIEVWRTPNRKPR